MVSVLLLWKFPGKYRWWSHSGCYWIRIRICNVNLVIILMTENSLSQIFRFFISHVIFILIDLVELLIYLVQEKKSQQAEYKPLITGGEGNPLTSPRFPYSPINPNSPSHSLPLPPSPYLSLPPTLSPLSLSPLSLSSLCLSPLSQTGDR